MSYHIIVSLDSLITSIFEIRPKGKLSSWLCPSGVVSGIPSTNNLIPLIPNADLAPKPLIDILKIL